MVSESVLDVLGIPRCGAFQPDALLEARRSLVPGTYLCQKEPSRDRILFEEVGLTQEIVGQRNVTKDGPKAARNSASHDPNCKGNWADYDLLDRRNLLAP